MRAVDFVRGIQCNSNLSVQCLPCKHITTVTSKPQSARKGSRSMESVHERTEQTMKAFSPLTPKLAFQLAAPHTWPASILPVLVAVGAAANAVESISLSMVCILLIICILMQSAVNTFNDYFDYVKGTDSKDDNVEVTDATLVYNNVNPKHVLALAVLFLLFAFAMGIYVIVNAGIAPLIIGLVGAAITVLYSAGKTPISYLPIGEFVSGFVMGGLIPLACYHALTGQLSLFALIASLPTIIGVGLIMATNNTCDIEKDITANRKTLPVLLGRTKARSLYHIAVYVWVLAIIAIVVTCFTTGLIVLPFCLLASYPLLKALLSNPLVPTARISAMAQICSVNVALGAFYASALFASSSGVSLVL